LHNDHTDEPDDIGVTVPLARIAEGWPPFEYEILKVADLGVGYRVDCIPWFTYGLNRHDVISAAVQDGTLKLQDVIERSGHCTFRMRLHLHSISESERAESLAMLTALSVGIVRVDAPRIGDPITHSPPPTTTSVLVHFEYGSKSLRDQSPEALARAGTQSSGWRRRSPRPFP
jgi:hypothetical protein